MGDIAKHDARILDGDFDETMARLMRVPPPATGKKAKMKAGESAPRKRRTKKKAPRG